MMMVELMNVNGRHRQTSKRGSIVEDLPLLFMRMSLAMCKLIKILASLVSVSISYLVSKALLAGRTANGRMRIWSKQERVLCGELERLG